MRSDLNKKVHRLGQIARQERLRSPAAAQNTKATRHGGGSGDGDGDGRIFEVQDKADTGYGLYKCYEQKLDATNWDDETGEDEFADKDTTEVEVLNLLENDPIADAIPALGKYDRLRAWTVTDDEDNSRWVGIPLTPQLREVKATQAAQSEKNYVACNLVLNDGAEADSGELGEAIDVYGRINGAGTDLSICQPGIASGDTRLAQCIQGKWWFYGAFQQIGEGLEISSDKLTIKLNGTTLSLSDSGLKGNYSGGDGITISAAGVITIVLNGTTLSLSASGVKGNYVGGDLTTVDGRTIDSDICKTT